jgi:hypothetical protein
LISWILGRTNLLIFGPEGLPFDVRVAPPPLFASGRDVHVRATFTAALSDVSEVDGLIDAFCMLASSGGLSGEHISPEQSDIADRDAVKIDERVLTWRLAGCRVDERSVVSLVNLLHFGHMRNEVKLLEIAGTQSSPMERLVASNDRVDYPHLFPPPFQLLFREPLGASVSLVVRPRRSLTEPEVAEFEETLLMWSVAPTVGAFAVPDVPIETNQMEPEQMVEVEDDQLRWNIERFRMHPAAIDSLVNCCAAFSSRVAPIGRLEIS